MPASRYPVNVKIPEEYVRLIDENLKPKRPLSHFTGRAHFVRTAVYKLLVEYNIPCSIHPNDFGKQRGNKRHDP